ncbi:MAG TPA: glutamine--tRNA ligase/YqeY domain fusion protein [Terriglobales bacterium]|nr:glutamine--tRNA ligase/YqeY domain fusion protein [Terriglobales bacterium]
MKAANSPAEPAASAAAEVRPSNFLRDIIVEDLKTNKFGDAVIQTRFPPEPNGYLHIGHAKAICLDFGLADEFGGKTNLRFDDTNPEKEETEYVESIKEDVRWLGFDWERLCYASDYFDQLYEWALKLIREGKAYVDDLSADEIREYRGTLTKPGKNSLYRERSIKENLDLFQRMRAGEFPDGSRVLRAKIDMASPNLNMRDPVMYRILHAEHHRTGDKWCIYPMYDYAHGQSDSIERVTHSMCTLEFADHQPLYRWYIEQLGIFPSEQTEFDRLNLTYTLLSKRKLLQLVRDGHVAGWDDPRMPTLSGIRRRGYPPEAIRNFVTQAGVSRTNGITDFAMLEHFVREDLNRRAPRVMAVLRPLKLVIDNYPEGQSEDCEAVNNPEDPAAGTRKVPFSRVLYIEQDDFREVPPKGYFRLSPGREVRLRYGYFVKCTNIVKNGSGEVVEVHCTYDPATRGGNAPDGRKVKATIHWVSAAHAIDAEVRLYDKLFTKPDPSQLEEGEDFTANLNPLSLEVVGDAKLEPSLASAAVGSRYQFERLGYFCVDPDCAPGRPVFNRTVALKDTWAKIEKKAR